ncbi:HNH endonuclease [bacterium]|nr:HNH endonuclease [bacterium]
MGLKSLLKELKKTVRKAAPKREMAVAVEAAKPMPTGSRYIPRGMRRQLDNRDERRCQEKRPDGSICGESRFLEIDHIQPFALGGPNKPENLRLLCWAHNALRAEATFGKWQRRRSRE